MTRQVYKRTATRIGILVMVGTVAALSITSAAALEKYSPVPLAPDVASYRIEAVLSADGTTIAGTELVTYRNPSPDMLSEVYLHLYLNAFESPDTVWMREAGGAHRGFGFDGMKASITVESVATADGRPLTLEFESDPTIARVPLPYILLPGDEITLKIVWTSHLPRVFARTGWAPGGFTMAGQWYPKLAVYDPRRGGWDFEPWHSNAEFFHDFGSYDLTLTVPVARTVISNGESRDSSRDNGDGTSTSRFHASSVTDIVWLAAERLLVQSRTVGDVTIAVALPVDRPDLAGRYFDIAVHALGRYSEWLGPYPWPRLTVVIPPPDAAGAGGMEYPSFVTSVLPPVDLRGVLFPEMVTAHEIAHQWFPMQLATNEAREPWMDEAFADYLTQRLMAERYGPDSSVVDLPFAHAAYLSELRASLPAAARLPITLPAWQYTNAGYGAAVYGKGSLFLTTLQRVFGADRYTRALQRYVAEWRWRHPLPNDFQSVLSAELDNPPGSTATVGPWFDQLASGQAVLGVRVSADGHGGYVERFGDAALPVDGVLVLDSGERLSWLLDADAKRLDLTAPPGRRVAAIVADPDDHLVIVLDRVSSGYDVQPRLAELFSILGRLAGVVALLLQSLGQFG